VRRSVAADNTADNLGRGAVFLKAKHAYARHARRKRAALFRALFPDALERSILDLGGSDGSHFAMVVPGHKNVTIADIDRKQLDKAETKYGFKTRQIDGTLTMPFDDGEFDIVFCSSVIEHVTGPKEKVGKIRDTAVFEAEAVPLQQKFASEIRRIGRGYFVQTPYKHFPIESHTNSPGLVMLLPRAAQLEIWKRWPTCRHAPDFHLLTVKDMKRFFPGAEIHLESALGLTKSIMAVKRV
jgi:hypothetical protein